MKHNDNDNKQATNARTYIVCAECGEFTRATGERLYRGYRALHRTGTAAQHVSIWDGEHWRPANFAETLEFLHSLTVYSLRDFFRDEVGCYEN